MLKSSDVDQINIEFEKELKSITRSAKINKRFFRKSEEIILDFSGNRNDKSGYLKRQLEKRNRVLEKINVFGKPSQRTYEYILEILKWVPLSDLTRMRGYMKSKLKKMVEDTSFAVGVLEKIEDEMKELTEKEFKEVLDFERGKISSVPSFSDDYSETWGTNFLLNRANRFKVKYELMNKYNSLGKNKGKVKEEKRVNESILEADEEGILDSGWEWESSFDEPKDGHSVIEKGEGEQKNISDNKIVGCRRNEVRGMDYRSQYLIKRLRTQR